MINQYRTYRFVDGKARWIIVDENEKIINRNPSKEELKGLEKEIYFKKKYNETNTCDRCGIDFDIATGHPHREQNKERNWTEKWLCQGCYYKERYKNGNTNNNLIKSLANHRTNNLDPNSATGKGNLFQELTCRWRSTISTIPIEDLNKKLDNYHSPIDHTLDSELGTIQTQGRFYDSRNRRWGFYGLEREWEKEFNNMICYCASKDGKIIERLYIFPKNEIEDRTGISIYKNPSRCEPWYEQYRVTDEKTLELVNKIWKEIIRK